jgi:type II secretory pathway component GspD/PulD (secretin)
MKVTGFLPAVFVRFHGESRVDRKLLGLFFCALIMPFAAWRAASAADPEFVGLMAVAAEREVAEELQLSETEYNELLEWIDEREADATEIVLTLRDQPEELKAKMQVFASESEEIGLKRLTPEQQKRLRQLQISRTGLATLGHAPIREQLDLTPEQIAQIDKLLENRAEATSRGGDDERAVARAEYERKLAMVLSAEQRLAWEKLAGLAKEADDQVADVDDPTSEPAETPADEPATTLDDDSPADDSTEEGDNEPVAEADVPTPDDVELRFNFRYAPWKTVLEWFADQADLSLELTSVPPGTFNYTDRKAYTPAEAIDLLNSVLLTKGFTLLRHRRMLMVINLEDGIPPNLVETVDVSELDERGKFELVSCLFPVKNITAEEAEREIKTLLGPQGSIVVLPKTSAILVTETAGKLRVIRELLGVASNPADAAGDEAVQEIALENVLAEEVLGVIRQLLGLPEDRNAAADGSLRIAVDTLGTRLFVTGEPEKVERVREILKLVDVPSGFEEGGPKILETPQLEVYAISSADPESVLKVMQTLMAGEPDVRLDIDPKSGNLIALARPTQHATIQATIEQMQRDSRQIDVIRLRVVDPQLAVLAINKLYGTAAEGEINRGPTVDADPTTGNLLVRGTDAQIKSIRELLEKMGETGFDDVEQVAAADRGNVRMIPLTGASARAALEQMEMIWPTMRKNRIRIVTPSAAVREMRPSESSGGVRSPSTETPLPFDGLDALFPSFEIRPRSETAPKGGTKPPMTNPQPAPTPAPSDSSEPTLDTDTEARARAQGVPFRFVADRTIVAQADAPAAPAAPTADKPQIAPPAETAEPATEPAEPANDDAPAEPKSDAGKSGAEIIVAPGPSGIMIASEDLDALDEFEAMLQTLAERAPTGREYTVFYLKFARAEVAAELLNEILGGSGGAEEAGGAGGNLVGDLASGLLGDAGGGLFGSLLGLGGGGGGAISTSGTVTLVADRRLNALVVQANATDLDTVEQLLEVIDQEASPEDVQTVAKPRLIPVFYTSAAEIAEVVKQVYASRIAGAGGGGGQQRQPSPEEFIQALRGGGRNSRGGRGGRSAQDQEQTMTVGVDSRSNSIVVAAPEPLFQEVKLLVEQLDQAGAEEAETMRVVTLKSASPELVQRAIVSITGGKVTTNTTTSPSSSNSRSSDSRSSRSSSNQDSSERRQPSSDDFQEQVRQRIELFNQMQRGGDQGSSRGGREGGAQGGTGIQFNFPSGGPSGGGRSSGGGFGGRRGGR